MRVDRREKKPNPTPAWNIMADFDRQKVATELRKFRKKLRQIEKLEDLERELTEEEYLKVMVKVKISY